MPFFDDQDRSGLRRLYLEAWRKARERRPLEPLENQIVGVIELHPEYQSLLADHSAALDRDFAPEQGQTNPFLHMGLHLAIRDQVATDRPPGVRAVYQRLAARMDDRHEVEHRMMDRLAEALWQAQRSGRPPDESAYLRSLRQLER
jgi:hypothetical protein